MSRGARSSSHARTEAAAADALLRAAAPELLAAAKLAALHFTRQRLSGNFQGDDEHEAWTALEKAIARAEGK